MRRALPESSLRGITSHQTGGPFPTLFIGRHQVDTPLAVTAAAA